MTDLIRGRRGIFAVRDVHSLMTETEEAGHELKRAVSAPQLTAMGVGAIIGTGIFVVIGQGVGLAGPAVILSFVLAAVACTFSALSYAELASSIPVSGSAYTYSYATLGEIVAWIIGWDLVLEYGVSVAAVAIGWGGKPQRVPGLRVRGQAPDATSQPREEGGVFNLPAVIIVVAITLLLVLGVRDSARADLVMVGVKLVVLTFFIIVALFNLRTSNFTPFMPDGFHSVTSAAAIIFFAYIGAELALRTSAALRLVTVVAEEAEVLPLFIGRDAERAFSSAAREAYQFALDTARAGLPTSVDSTAEVLVGDVLEVLAELDESDVDVLVCSSRGYGPVRRVLLGGVSARLVRRARSPVLVVPRGN